MADLIKLLPDGVVNQIAAGEVIQRPASVVKELMDNAIDSGATEIKLVVKDAGKSMIQISDNGCGMSVTDVRMSFERHATSKIRQASDLFDIQTMGFRGEALASIASVAQVDMRSKRHSDTIGTKIVVADSKVKSQEPCACPSGTQIQVQHLFYNVPARRKFLKSDTVELRHIHDEFINQAIAHPEIKFIFIQQENEIYHLTPGSLKNRIVSIFGKKYQEELIPLEQDTDVVRISGFIGKPGIAKKVRGEQLLFVNRRFIKSPYLNHAVISSYQEIIDPHYFPFFILFLNLDPTKIDINVHPTKHEIKFDDERVVYNFLRISVKYALGSHTISPQLDFENANPGLDNMFQSNPIHSKQIQGSINEKPMNMAHWKQLTMPEVSRNIIEQRESTLFNPSNREQENQEFLNDSVETDDHHPIQIHQKYILIQTRKGIMFIDQQSAHERILYEYYKKAIGDLPQITQRLLFPQTLHLNTQDAMLLKPLLSSFHQLGFEIEEFGSDSFIIHGMPMLLDGKFNETEFIHQVLDQYKLNLEFQLGVNENISRSLAKSSCIKVGKTLTELEMKTLIEQLFECENPYKSANGKTCFYILTMDELAKKLN